MSHGVICASHPMIFPLGAARVFPRGGTIIGRAITRFLDVQIAAAGNFMGIFSNVIAFGV